jgi:phosphate transport system permease protein
MAIIACILGILLFIVVEVAPLVEPARVEPLATVATAGPAPAAIVADEHRSLVAELGRDGVLRVVRTSDGGVVLERAITVGAPTGAVAVPGRPVLAAASPDGSVRIVPISWEVAFADGARTVTPSVAEPTRLVVDPAGRPLGPFAARQEEDGTAAAAQLADGTIALVQAKEERNEITGAVTFAETRSAASAPGTLGALLLDGERRNLYGGTAAGEVVWWRIGPDGLSAATILPAGGAAITALGLLIGDRSLVVGQADGLVSIWFQARGPNGAFQLTRVREFPTAGSAILAIAPSWRDKGFLTLTAGGDIGLYHSTSGRTLWRGRSPVSDPSAIVYAPKGDGALVAAKASLGALAIHNPHPEISLGTLFRKVWYEGYEQPEYVWQSSAGGDDFEPKLSLVPLLVGTLKGTFYSLILAIPLGVFGAMYTSQFMHPRLQRIVKPTVEIMAALPSVVLGFLAGLWLAPRVEQAFPALLAMAVALPAVVLGAGAAWRALPTSFRGRFPTGSEAALYLVVLALAIWGCLAAAGPLARTFFGGSFQAWLLEASGWRYDQRNAIVVGLAMGFAVIPLIFAIAEDAFSNVPRALVSGSLALGANRWQTVTRVVLPSASAGIFSAVMIGFGRAVGETMIVLMATGNTPILDWNPFNGFRTLSANIATEIPEAPYGGTLYRTLFLAALLLFVVTFAVNTAAEIVRQRLRRRYAQP